MPWPDFSLRESTARGEFDLVAPKGNKNALKHGLYARKPEAALAPRPDPSWDRHGRGSLDARSPDGALGSSPGSSTRTADGGTTPPRLVVGEVVDGPLTAEGASTSPLPLQEERLQGLRRGSAQRDGSMRGPERTIRYLEEVIDEIFARVKRAEGEEFTRLANALSLAATALFNGHRTVAFLTGGMTSGGGCGQGVGGAGF